MSKLSLGVQRVAAPTTLDGLATAIRTTWAETKQHQTSAWEGYFRVGRLLIDVRARFPGDREYGRWLATQEFEFSREWANRLARLADRENDARALLGSALPGTGTGVDAILAELRQADARERGHDSVADLPLPDGRYRCLIIDPPWPMAKIEREERPDQGVVLDYPVMSLDEIAALPVLSLAESAGCHVYLWVTHRFLPDGLRLFDAWGVTYQCVMTWVKNVGMTPFSWMYDTEHVLFGRVGSLQLEQLGLRLSFSAPVTRHSAKPDVFYERVLAASPGPRLELFARARREGFDAWGNEVTDAA